MIDLGLIGYIIGSLIARGRDVVDFTNDILNNIVSLTGDAHQAKVAQDIFRQEVRYERSLQMREDIRDMNKVMLESVQSYLFLGSIILSTSFTTTIEGFPPDNTSRMVMAWWLLFGGWATSNSLLAIWLSLAYQVRISAASRERLLRRYRYRLVDDGVVKSMGGMSLINSFFHMGELVTNTLNVEKADPMDSAVQVPEDEEETMSVRVESLDPEEVLDTCMLRKGLFGWIHYSGVDYENSLILDVPEFLLNETLIRSHWVVTGEKPLLLRIYGEATLYIAAQCPPLGGVVEEGMSGTTVAGFRQAIGADVPEWPEDERPILTAGFHPAWRGPSGYGEMLRVEGASFFVDTNHRELPVYKIVLAGVPNTCTDVIVCWRFKTCCEALMICLRKDHVHCKEEDWPIAEFNEEIRKLSPLQDYAGYFLRRSIFHLMVNVVLSVLTRVWVVGERELWWMEAALMVLVFMPAVTTIYLMPINIKTTKAAYSISMVNQSGESKHLPPPPPDPRSRSKETASFDMHNSEATSEGGSVQGSSPSRSASPSGRAGSKGSTARGPPKATRAGSKGGPRKYRKQVSFHAPGENSIRSVAQKSREQRNQLWHWKDLPIRPAPDLPQAPESNPRRAKCFSCRRRFVKACLPCVTIAEFSDSVNGPSGNEDTPAARSLNNFTRGLDFIFFCCCMAIIASPSLDFFQKTPELGPEPTVPVRRLGEGQLAWTQWSVDWPPFFEPTGLALAGDGRTLHAAAGSVLRTARQGDGASWTCDLGRFSVLPEAALGLGFAGPRLLAIGGAGVYEIQLSSPRDGAAPGGGALDAGLLGLLGAAVQPGAEVSRVARHALASVAAGAVLEVGSAPAVLLASRGQGVHLGAFAPEADGGAGEAEPELALLARLELLEWALEGATGVHASAPPDAGEPILWAATRRGILALDLVTGGLLANISLPQASALPPPGGVQLAGNATHLVVAMAWEGASATVFSAPLPALRG